MATAATKVTPMPSDPYDDGAPAGIDLTRAPQVPAATAPAGGGDQRRPRQPRPERLLVVERSFQDGVRRMPGEVLQPADYSERLIRQLTEQHKWHETDSDELGELVEACSCGRRWREGRADGCPVCGAEEARKAAEREARAEGRDTLRDIADREAERIEREAMREERAS